MAASANSRRLLFANYLFNSILAGNKFLHLTLETINYNEKTATLGVDLLNAGLCL